MKRLSQTERVDLSDSRMTQTAIRLIVELGIGGTKLTEVGMQSGYSRGLAAMRFGTKAGLLRRVARYVLSGWVSRVSLATTGKLGLAAVFAAIDAQYRWIAEEPDQVRALYLIFFHSIDPNAEYHLNVGSALVAQRHDLARWLAEARVRGEIVADSDDNIEAAQILSSMLGFVYQSLMDKDLPLERLHVKLKQDLQLRLSLVADTRSQAIVSC